MKRLLLLLPGPMQVPESVAEAAKRPLFAHRSPKFMEFKARLESRVRPLFGTTSDVLFLSAPGTGAMESAVVNMTSPGDEIIVMVGGVFAQRWAAIGEAFGLTVRRAEVDWRYGATAEDVRQAMERWPHAAVVCVTWSESSTGVLIELESIGRAVREAGKWLVADAVSGLAVSPLRMDAWDIDVVIVGSQKGLMLPPGLGLVAVGPRAWERSKTAKSPRFTWDWPPYRDQVPVTPPLSLMHQLDAAMDLIEGLGPGGVYERRAHVAERIRALVEANGLEIYAKRPGNGITGVIPSSSIDIPTLLQRLEDEYSIVIAGGLGRLKGQILRIGHVGHLTDEELNYFCESFEKVVSAECSA
jgi:aspartate aminotransferase-like enzyme